MAEAAAAGRQPHDVRGERSTRVLEKATLTASLLVGGIAVLTLVGWLLESRALVRFVAFADASVMMPNTAVGLLLSAAALGLLRSERTTSTAAGRMGRGIAALTAVFGVVVLLEYITGVDPGIDRILFSENVQRLVERAPGRPAATTAVSFIATGLGLLMLDQERRGLRPAQILALVPGFVGIGVLAGYGYRQGTLWAPGAPLAIDASATRMAVHTAVSFVALALGILLARPARGFMSIFTGDDSGAYISRRLLPAAILVPLFLGWIRLLGERAGLYDPATGVALFAVATMVAFTMLIGWSAGVVRRFDVAKDRAEAALRAEEERYRRLVETAYEGIWVIDREGRTEFVNRRMSEMLGYSVDEVMGRPVFDFMRDEERERAERLMERRRAGVKEVHEFRFTRRDGSDVWALMSTSPIVDEQGRYIGALAMATDITQRKRASDELRESEARFRSIFERAGIGIVLADHEGRFIMTNPVIQRFLGYRPGELEGMRFTEITHPEDIDLDWSLFRELVAGTRDTYQIEKRYVRKDGAVVWGRLTGSLVRSPDEGYAYAIGMVEDITARKELEEERMRLTAVLEATPDFVGTADADGRVKSLNRAGRAMTGIGEDEDVGRYRIADLHPPEALSVILGQGIPAAIREGVWTGETSVKSRDGREIPVSQAILAHRGPNGEVDYLSTVIRDISDRIRREENERFLLEASRVLTASLDEEEIIQGVAALVAENLADYCIIDRVEADGVVRTTGVHRQPGHQQLIDELCDFPPVPGRGAGAAAVLRTGRPERVIEVSTAWLKAVSTSEAHLRLLQRLDLHSQLVVPIEAHDQLIGALTLARTSASESFGPDELRVAQDLARRIAVAVENCRLYVESQQATRTRDEVLRVVAHDLRNPLSTIGLAAGAVLDTLPASMAAERRQLEIVRRSVRISNRLIQDLLDVARMQAGRLSVDTAPVETATVAREAVELHQSMAGQKALRLDAEIPADLPPIRADRERILQVFSNLIGNAIKFTPQGGRIVVNAEPADGVVRFSVADTGPGIPDQDRPHLFDPFWQARPGSMGAGLGLPLARGIVEAHGGRMDVDSEPGAGSTFSFTIPTDAGRVSTAS